MVVLGILLAAVPFVFAALRAVTTGSDFRYFLLAVASTLAVAFMLGLKGRTMRESRRVLRALILATVTTFIVGQKVGGANNVSVFIVALGFAICSTAGITLFLRARAGDGAPPSTD